MSNRLGANRRDTPRVIVAPGAGSEVAGIGEPSLTADGLSLSFVIVFRNSAGEFNADIGRVRR